MRSDSVKRGYERAPHRSQFYAVGLTPDELDRPLIGVVNSYNEIVPGHIHLDKVGEAVKAGVRIGGIDWRAEYERIDEEDPIEAERYTQHLLALIAGRRF